MKQGFARIAALAAVFAVGIFGAGLADGVAPPSASAAPSSASFNGFNWADPGDNYQSGPVVPSGLSSSNTYQQVYDKSISVLTDLSQFGANTVRLPVNPPSVGSGSSWWPAYQGTIDAAIHLNQKVILGYWESSDSKDGTVDNTTSWYSMWSTIVAKYGSNSLVYFEPMNEPHGYSLTDWSNLAAQWMSNYPSIPADHVIISGTGYDQDVAGVCADSRFAGTLFAFHDYTFFTGNETYAQRVSDMKNALGSCASRTIMDEFGAPTIQTDIQAVSGGGTLPQLDYNGSDTSGSATANNYVAYIQAVTDTARSLGMGSVYWPGVRDGDPYSLTHFSDSADDTPLVLNNQSMLDRIHYGWGQSGSAIPQATQLISAASGRCLDVPGGSKSIGTFLEIYDCNGGSNQLWLNTSSGQLQVYGSMCLDGYQQGTTPGTRVDIYTCNGGTNQQWTLTSSGTIVSKQSGLCLDVLGAGTANGTSVGLYTCNGGTNQKWRQQ